MVDNSSPRFSPGFGRKAIAFTASLCAVTASIWASNWTTQVSHKLAARIALWLLKTFTIVFVRGLYVWKRGLLRLVKDPAAKYIELDTGRTVEYFTYGSARDDAAIVVALHGSGGTGKKFNQYWLPEDVLNKMNCRVISPSYPGHGGSDMQPNRRITEWPLTDLIPILEKEKVEKKFFVVGASYGTSHGMSVASALPERVLGLGLVVPYLPETICREAGLWTDADMILRESQLENPAILLPILGMFFLSNWFIGLGIKHGYAEGKEIATRHRDLCNVLIEDAHRSFMRGVNGQVFEMLNAETTQTWPDPRKLRIDNIAVWYALDDTLVPPEHGAWLEKNLASEGRRLSVRKDKIGLGHFTWFVGESRKRAEIVKTLLENAKI